MLLLNIFTLNKNNERLGPTRKLTLFCNNALVKYIEFKRAVSLLPSKSEEYVLNGLE